MRTGSWYFCACVVYNMQLIRAHTRVYSHTAPSVTLEELILGNNDFNLTSER